MGALITKEADSMSAMQFRMRKAGEALWRDIKNSQKQRGSLKKESIKEKEKWCSRVSFNHEKAGAGWTLCTDGKAGTWIS